MKAISSRAGACLLLGITAASVSPLAASAQTALYDRRPVLTGVSTTDDARQIPRRTPSGGKVLVLTGGRVFNSVTGKSAPGTVVIRGESIEALLAPGAAPIWGPEAEVIDVGGKTVMPGLIDLHVHSTYPNPGTPIDEGATEGDGVLRGAENLRIFLEHGFTSVRDMGGVLNAPFQLSAWSAENRIPAPRVFAAGHIITGTGGHAAERPVTANHSPAFTWERDGADEWRAAVRQVFKEGGGVIKIASHFAPDEVQAAVDEAHRLGLKVACDCETIYIEMAVKAGVDDIEHPLPRTDEVIKEMARKGVVSVPTIQVYQNNLDARGGFYGVTSRRFNMTSEGNLNVFRKMKAAGVVMGVGTDTIAAANAFTPNFYIGELKWFAKLGYTPAEALSAATLTNAKILNMGDRLGSIEAGKLADVIVVDGRPDENLDDLAKVTEVVKGGQVWVRGGSIVLPKHQAKPLPGPAAAAR